MTDAHSPSSPRRRGRRPLWAAGAALVIVVALVGGWFVFLRSDAPPEVDLADAVENIDAVTTTSTASAGDGPATTGTSSASSASTQTWTVDPSITGSDGGSFAGFRIEEELSSIGSTTAVGRTSGVTGTVVLEGTQLMSGEFTVDLTSITTDDSRRDDKVQTALETSAFPEATFVADGPIDLGTLPADGEAISVSVPGTLTVHGVSEEITMDLDAVVSDGVLTIVGSTTITFSDFGVSAPSSPVVLSVSDEAVVEVQLYLTEV